MTDFPIYISIIFGLTTLLSVWFFYKASGSSETALIILLSWLAAQTLISLTGFYTVTNTMPPRFMILVLPPLLMIIGLFIIPKGRSFIDRLDKKTLTLLHIVRIPIEIVLFLLYVNKAVPKLMTFEGRNFDILAGLTAPLVFYFVFINKQIGRKLLLFWNIICLGLLVNIIINAVLSAPFPFQQFGFEQPNIAVLYFPFIWLPCCVVPLVLLSHLTLIRQLLKESYKKEFLTGTYLKSPFLPGRR